MHRQREDHGIARWANAILLLDDRQSCTRITKFLYLDDVTSRGWYKSYRQDGWDVLAFDGWRRSVPYEAGTGGCVMRLAGSPHLSLDGRDLGLCRS